MMFATQSCAMHLRKLQRLLPAHSSVPSHAPSVSRPCALPPSSAALSSSAGSSSAAREPPLLVGRPSFSGLVANLMQRALLDKRKSAETKRRLLVTTPIFYVNGAPHIGHMFTCVLADAYARWRRLCGDDVFLTSGTDEHGLKVQQSAAAQGLPAIELCDTNSRKFLDLLRISGVAHDDFVRTTEARHRETAVAMWRAMQANGHISRQKFSGWYCVSDEVFVPEAATAAGDGGRRVSAESGHAVEWVEEENYIFTPGRCEDKLLQWLDGQGPPGCVVTPKERLHEVKAMLVKGSPHVSVSRPAARLSWGIPVPDDPSQTMYVWVDALSSYLTGCKSAPGGAEGRWSSTVHFIGKDILRFHAVLWPMFLSAAGHQPPSRIIAHGHWTVGKVKMSKSWGNVIDPVKLVDAVGVSAARYFMLREGGLSHDGEFDATLLLRRFNGELADTIGNLLSRCCALACKAGEQAVLQPGAFRADDMRLMAAVNFRLHEAALLFNDADFHKGLPLVFSAATEINKYLTALQPWVVTKTDRQRALHIVYTALHCLRAVAALLSPVIPDAASQLLAALGSPLQLPGVALSRMTPIVLQGRPPILFKKIEINALDDVVRPPAFT